MQLSWKSHNWHASAIIGLRCGGGVSDTLQRISLRTESLRRLHHKEQQLQPEELTQGCMFFLHQFCSPLFKFPWTIRHETTEWSLDFAETVWCVAVCSRGFTSCAFRDLLLQTATRHWRAPLLWLSSEFPVDQQFYTFPFLSTRRCVSITKWSLYMWNIMLVTVIFIIAMCIQLLGVFFSLKYLHTVKKTTCGLVGVAGFVCATALKWVARICSTFYVRS